MKRKGSTVLLSVRRRFDKIRRIFVGLLALATFSGCTAQLYNWNLKYAYVTPWTHLSPADREAIVRLISDRAEDPIIGITEEPPSPDDGSTISVYTGSWERGTERSWHGYNLKKENGKWRVTFHGDCSHTIANLDLSGQFRKIQRRKASGD